MQRVCSTHTIECKLRSLDYKHCRATTLRNKSVQGWSITVMLAGELKAPDKTAGARKQGAGARGKIYVTCGPFIGRYLLGPDWS